MNVFEDGFVGVEVEIGGSVVGNMELLPGFARHLMLNDDWEGRVGEMMRLCSESLEAKGEVQSGAPEDADPKKAGGDIAAALLLEAFELGMVSDAAGLCGGRTLVLSVGDAADWTSLVWGFYAERVYVPRCYGLTRGEIVAALRLD